VIGLPVGSTTRNLSNSSKPFKTFHPLAFVIAVNVSLRFQKTVFPAIFRVKTRKINQKSAIMPVKKKVAPKRKATAKLRAMGSSIMTEAKKIRKASPRKKRTTCVSEAAKKLKRKK
jgi:hypothetical protein